MFAVLAAPGDTVGFPADNGRGRVLLADFVGIGRRLGGDGVQGLKVRDERQRELAVLREGLTINGDVGRATGGERIKYIEAETEEGRAVLETGVRNIERNESRRSVV